MFEIFQFDFMIRAFAAGGVTAIIAPLLGNFLVVRRYSLMADTLAHVALVGAALSLLLGTNPILTAVVTSLVVGIVIEKLRSRGGITGESILAIFLSSSLAVVAIIISLIKGTGFNLSGFLFGSIVTVLPSDLVYIVGLGVVTLLVVVLIYKPLFLTSFDEEIAQASGIRVQQINTVLILLTALTVSVSIRVIGALLTGALMIIPVMAATQISKSFKQNVVFSILFSLLAVVIGLFVSYYLNLASGGTIVIVALLIFILTLIVKVR